MYPGTFVVRFINGLVGIIEFALALRFVLELFGANPSSQFIAWIYGVTNALIGPFVGAFPGLYIGGNFVIDIVAILAMIAYAILGWLIVRLLSFVFISTRAF
jgi:hypothetical protein